MNYLSYIIWYIFKTLFKIKAKDFRWDLRASADKITQTVTQLNIPSYSTGPGYNNSSIFLIVNKQRYFK